MGKDQELLEAARTGNTNLVEKLLHSKSKSSAFAASIGLKSRMKKLFKIRVGAHVNCQDQNGYTPLHHASLNGHSDIVQLLLDVGASVNTKDKNGSRPLHLAAWNGKSEIVKILLTNGPNFASVNEQNADKETALHCAAQHGHRESVKILLDNHADPELRNIRDESALDLASQYGRLEVVRLLLSCHPNLLARSPERFTPLHLASRNGHRGVVELLLVHGADINKVGANGTALHEAALFGKYDVVSLLLKRGAETGSKDTSGRSALELVSQLDTQISRDIAKLIIARIQEGEDYEPFCGIVSSTPQRRKLGEDMKARNEFDKPTNVFVASPTLSRNLSHSFGEADLVSREPSRGRPSISPSFRYSRSSQLSPETSKSPSGHRIRLRRTSSARSARSLPRLVSTASFHGNRSLHSLHGKKSDVTSMQDWSVRQHHPSIDMFPVTPTRASQTSRKTSSSEPSSPTHLGPMSISPIRPGDTPEVVVHGTPLRLEDDNVFFPGTPTSGRPSFETFLPSNHSRPEPKTVIPLKPPADDSTDSKIAKSLFTPSSQQKIIPIIITKSSPGDSPLDSPQQKLTLVMSSDTPPPLPKKSTASPPCGIEPSSPPIPVKKSNSQPEQVIIDPESTKSKETGKSSFSEDIIPPNSMTFEGHQSSGSIKHDSSSILNASISSASDLSPTVKSPNAPRKPQRNRPVLSPPPLPPKPAHMMQEPKRPRPPSPTQPPPLDDDEDIFAEEEEIESFSRDVDNDDSSFITVEGEDITRLPDSTTVTETNTTEAGSQSRSCNLSPPLSSCHSGSTTSTISTVIFIPSPTNVAKSDSSDSPDTDNPMVEFEPHEDPASLQCDQDLSQKSGNTTPESPFPTDSNSIPNFAPVNSVSPQNDDNSSIIDNSNTTQNKSKEISNQTFLSPKSATISENTTIEIINLTYENSLIDQNTVKTSISNPVEDNSTSNDTPVSPTLRSPSPPFSPPSPNTAMLQVSSAIQKAIPTEKSSINTSMQSSSSTSFSSLKTNLTNTQLNTEPIHIKENELNSVAPKTAPSLHKTITLKPNLEPGTSTKPSLMQGRKQNTAQQDKSLMTPTIDKESVKVLNSQNVPNVSLKMSNKQPTNPSPSKAMIMPVHKDQKHHQANTTLTTAPIKKTEDVSLKVRNEDVSIKETNVNKLFHSEVSLPATLLSTAPVSEQNPTQKTNLIPADRAQPRSIPPHHTQPELNPRSPPTKTKPSHDHVTSQLSAGETQITVNSNEQKLSQKTDLNSGKAASETKSMSQTLPKPVLSNDTLTYKTLEKPAGSKTTPAEVADTRSNTLPKVTAPQVKPRRSIGARPWSRKITDSSHSLFSSNLVKGQMTVARNATENNNGSHTQTPLTQTKPVETVARFYNVSTTETTQEISKLQTVPIMTGNNQLKPDFEQVEALGPKQKSENLIINKFTNITSSPMSSIPSVNEGKILKPSIVLAPKPFSRTVSEKRTQSIKPALPKKRLSLDSIQQRNRTQGEFSTLTLPKSVKNRVDLRQLQSKSLTSVHMPVSTVSNTKKLSSTVNTKNLMEKTQQGGENEHKSALVRRESKNQQLRPQSDLYYTATEVKRARICSTRSVIEIPNTKIYSEYDNSQNENENPLARNKRSSSLGPQVKTPYPEPKPMNVQIEIKTAPSIRRRVSDAYTQTYPPKLKSRPRLSLQKSKSIDRVHRDMSETKDFSIPISQSSVNAITPAVPSPPKNTSESPNSSPRPVPKIKPALVSTPTKLQRPKKPTKPAHLLNYKPSIKAKTLPKTNTLKTEKELSSSNDDVFKAGSGRDLSMQHNSSLADKSAISVLSLDTSDDWNDALSDRTEDLNFPKDVRRFRGLIRGSSLSYRSRFTSCTARDPAYESDEFEYDYNVDSKASYSRVNPSLQPDDEFEDQRYNTVVTTESVNNSGFSRPQTKLAESGVRDDYMAQDRNVLVVKKPAQLIGEPGEKRRKEDLLLLRNTVTSQGGFINHAHSRDSSYDNNNNNNNTGENDSSKPPRPGTSSLPLSTMTSAPTIPSPMSDGLPDFSTIVDTVTAVRSKSSPHGSTSGVSSSSSSHSSTLPKQDPLSTLNENDEWAQIANMMKSVGNTLNKGPVYAQEFEETFWRIMTGSDLPRRVATWLSDLNLSQYEEVLCGNGFDNVNFLASDILEEQDLIDMNIQNESHRRRMLDSAKNLPKIRPLPQLLNGELSVNDNRPVPSCVSEWLLSIALGDLEQIFDTMGFNTLDKILKMKETEIAGMVRLRGHRKRIRASLGLNIPKSKPRSASLTSGRTNNKAKPSPPLSRSPLLDTVNFFKDYSQTTTSKVTTNTSLNLYGTASSSSSALTNYSSLSDQVVPIAISEEPEIDDFANKRGRKSGSTTQYTRSQSASTEPLHRRQSREQNKDYNRFPSQPGSSLNSRNHKIEKSSSQTDFLDTNSTNISQEDDLLSLAISRLTDGSVKKSVGLTNQENKENINMSTSDSTEIRVPDARRASYLSSNGDLVLRPPNETTEEEVTVSSWCHDPNVLIKSCCNYQAYYLGSMLVQEVKGVESTVEACNKMKKSTDSMKKIPTITLSISYKGVKFIDSKSKHEIAEHEIHNISFASQDADDLSTLAYITRDARTGNHYCHVFRVTTLDVAYEIILTLGQAFEVAYQLILKEKSMQEEEGS
uniref:uncharacterized protein LOC120334115 isoform X1 n=1 Tax=Styela clava TaxID=7725 RepID=UPI001939B77E|nr:uncharacterized protein LOC120334115 isoform X1 [Styela clava]